MTSGGESDRARTAGPGVRGPTGAAAGRAPEFELPSVNGGPVRLGDLLRSGPAVLLFVAEECPTCALTLRRLGPLVDGLERSRVTSVAVFEDPLEVAARTARRAGFNGVVLSEPAPYELSRDYQLDSVPTMLLVDPQGRSAHRVVGWDADGIDRLLEAACLSAGTPAPRVTDESPRRKPGCASKATYDPETLALLDGGSGIDEIEEMFDRGWSDGLPVVPPTSERVEAMLGASSPSDSLGPVPPGWARRLWRDWPPARCWRVVGRSISRS